MLQLLLLIPLIGSFLLLLIPEGDKVNNLKIKNLGLSVSIINFIVSIFLWTQFDSNTSGYQFVSEFSQLNFCQFNLGVDSISIYFILITTFLTPIAILASFESINKNVKLFIVSMLLLESFQIALFAVLDLFLFYVFFESILPILFVLIIVYGSGNNRVRAAFYLFLYTLAGSLPMLLAILTIYSNLGTTDFTVISLTEISLSSQKLLWIAFFIAFAVKTPLYPFHGWLPLAHTDAPVGCSILLAGTVLKLSTYGILRILINFLPDATHYFSPLVQTLAIISLIYGSLVTIVQQDIKGLIAYSSVCHMAIVTLGLFSNSIIGIEGAILLAIGHSFVSPALFVCVGAVLYDRFHTRNVAYYRGIANLMPVFTILFFIFILANTGLPLTLNWLGEQLSLIGMWERNPITAVIGSMSIVLSACYSIYLYNRISYGVYSPHLKPVADISRREFTLLISLLIPTVVFGIMPNVILDSLHLGVSTLLYYIPTPLLTYDNTQIELESILLVSSLVPLKKLNLNTNSYGLIKSVGNKAIISKPISNSASDKVSEDKRDLVSDFKFKDWLVGFIDGTFIIKVKQNSLNFEFIFAIALHIDDRDVLEYICNRLQIGKIGIYEESNVAKWVVSNKSDILKLIEILDMRSLNTSKYYDYFNWKEAFNLREEAKKSKNLSLKTEIQTKILALKANMNKNKDFNVLASKG